MRLVDLGVLYTVAGVSAAIALYHRSDRGRAALVSALTAVPLWPIWAPIAWTAKKETGLRGPRASGRLARIRAALEEAVESVRGTPLESLLGRDAAETILEEATRLSSRNEELVQLLVREEFDLAKSTIRLESIERGGLSPRVVASARLHVENVRRLHRLAERDARALDELAGLAVALRTELMVVKLSGSPTTGVDDLVGDLLAHIEGLRQASADALASPGERAFLPTPAT